MDWTQLGVNVGIVTGIISVVQFLRASFLQDLPGWVYLAIVMVFSGIVGYLTTEAGAGIEIYLRATFSYATASAWLYSVTKTTPGLKNLVGKKED